MEQTRKQIDLSDRLSIESGLYSGESFKQIAKAIGKHPKTVAREIKLNRTPIRGSYGLSSDCRYFRGCIIEALCANCNQRIKRCKHCTLVSCAEICNKYKPRQCKKLDVPPYVCNHCGVRRACLHSRYMYIAKRADALSNERRSESRKGIRLNDKDLQALDELISTQIKKGQPLSHIYAEHSNEIPISFRSLYNYIDSGAFRIRNIDLRRKVSYRKRRRSLDTTSVRQQACRIGRTYENYLEYMSDHPNASVVQMDTVHGRREAGKTILTMLFVDTNVMLMFLMPNCSSDAVLDVLNFLTENLGMETFQRLFEVILTDNGAEFKSADEIEVHWTGEYRTNLFYCDAQASWQKAEIEKNHEFIRYVIKKGTGLGRFYQADITLLCNHINSLKRLGLGNKCPYELVKDDEDMQKLMQVLKMHLIQPDEVHLTPALLM